MVHDDASWRLTLKVNSLALGQSQSTGFILINFQGTLSLHSTWFEPLFSEADCRLEKGLGFKGSINSPRDVCGWKLLDDNKE